MKQTFCAAVLAALIASTISCGSAPAADEYAAAPAHAIGTAGITVHFKRPSGWANTPKIYSWNTQPPAAAVKWPGVLMTDEGRGWYRHTFEGATFTNLIFNNDPSPQTADLSRNRDGWYRDGIWYDTDPEPQTPVVTATPAAGSYVEKVTVTLANSASGAIRYTLDGTTPVGTSPLYGGPFELTASSTVKALGYDAAGASGEVATFTYAITPKPKTLTVVIIGSSTSEGWGATNRYGWAQRYADYAKSVDAGNTVINIAKAGYSSADLLPSGDPERNITKALSFNPNVIIINLPSNDANVNRPVADQVANFNVFISEAAKRGVTLYATTTQPRSFPEDYKRCNLMDMKTEIYRMFGSRTIDFWTTIARDDGRINAAYDSGDGVHLNDAAHRVLYDRAKAMNILGAAGQLKKKVHYYSSKPSANLHYQTDADSWSAVPGVAMQPEGSGWFVREIADEGRLIFCFNDNAGGWDSNWGNNYYTLLSECWVKNGAVYAAKP